MSGHRVQSVMPARPVMPARHKRIAVFVAATLFLVLAGTGVARAYWSTTTSATVSTAAGVLSVTQSGFPNLAGSYGLLNLTQSAPITVTNTGTVPATATVAVIAPVASLLSAATIVTGWKVTAPSLCVASTLIDLVNQTATMTVGIGTSFTLAPGAVGYYCVRTAITSIFGLANVGLGLSAQSTVSATLGNWVSTSTANAVQSIADVTAPTTPTALTTTATSTTVSLNWLASTDNIGVTGYDLYQAGAFIATTAATSYASTALTKNTAYSFTVRAHDAAGNNSALSSAAAITTPIVDVGLKYKLLNTSSTLCLDAGAASTLVGQSLQLFACTASRVQNWMFVATSGGYYSVVPANQQLWAWTVNALTSTLNNANVTVDLNLALGTQQWMPVLDAGSTTSMHFVNKNSGKCLSAPAASTATGLQQYDCNGSAGQSYGYTVMP
jgi:hypothetical protein